ncbi:heat shock factor protein HSF8 [Pycnococcus provasolii]
MDNNVAVPSSNTFHEVPPPGGQFPLDISGGGGVSRHDVSHPSSGAPFAAGFPGYNNHNHNHNNNVMMTGPMSPPLTEEALVAKQTETNEQQQQQQQQNQQPHVPVVNDAEAAAAAAAANSEALSRRPFVLNTYRMVSDPSTDTYISWDPDGTSFTVHEPGMVSSHVLNKYFKHSNFSSFVRQLNSYAFHKINPDRWTFAHPDFRRDQPENLHKLVRRSSSSSSKKGAVDKGMAPGGVDIPGGGHHNVQPVQPGFSPPQNSAYLNHGGLLELGNFGGDDTAADAANGAITPYAAGKGASSTSGRPHQNQVLDVNAILNHKMSQVQRDRDVLRDEVSALRSRLAAQESQMAWYAKKVEDMERSQDNANQLNEWIVSILAQFPTIREGLQAGNFPPMPTQAKHAVLHRLQNRQTRRALPGLASAENPTPEYTNLLSDRSGAIHDLGQPVKITEIGGSGGGDVATLTKLRAKSPMEDTRAAKRGHAMYPDGDMAMAAQTSSSPSKAIPLPPPAMSSGLDALPSLTPSQLELPGLGSLSLSDEEVQRMLNIDFNET